MSWINETMQALAKDEKVVWKATSDHHPMFALSIPDYETIIDHMLPNLRDFDFDVYFTGHEHFVAYANTPAKLDPK